MFNFWGTATVGEPFYNPISKVWEFQFLHILPSTYYFPLLPLNSSYPSGFEVIRLVFFICISLVTNDSEHLNMCWLAICLSASIQFTGLFLTWNCLFIVLLCCHVWPLVTPWTVACQSPLSVAFFRQEYCSGLPSPSPGDLPNPRSKPASPALAGGFLTTLPPLLLNWKHMIFKYFFHFCELSFHFLHYVLQSRKKIFYFDGVQVIDFFPHLFTLWCHIQETIASSKVMEIYTCIFF